MSPSDDTAIIVFDGVCVLCNGWVRFLLRHDRKQRYRFAAMQSARGRELLLQHGLDPDNPASFLLIDREGAWADTQAIGRVLSGLGGPWRILSLVLTLTPRPVRDWAYRLTARNRYQWFGRRELCLIPGPAHSERFLS